MAKEKKTKAFNSLENIVMIVKNATIKIRDIATGYVDNSETDEGGVTSMNGRLNIRPKYQRAYIVNMVPNWRENLINSILCGFPINRIYLGAPDGVLGGLEVLDGQQRIKTICDFIEGDFPIIINGAIYHYDNLFPDQQEKILDYPLDITYCEGTESARIAWFKRINQPNSILTAQELRNATYIGTWLECAKKFFSAPTSRAFRQINDKNDKYYAGNYSSGRSIERSEYLELAIDWVAIYNYPDLRASSDEDERIMRYMAEHQHDDNAEEIIAHYKKVIDWVNDIFFHNGTPKKGGWQSVQHQEWGRLYAEYSGNKYTEEEKSYFSKRVKEILAYVNITFQKTEGVYEWILRGEKDSEISTYLYLRSFSSVDQQSMYMAQRGIDPIDGKHYEQKEMQMHHIKSWKQGGPSIYDNLVWLSKENHIRLHQGEFGITPENLKKLRDSLINDENFTPLIEK